MSRKFGRRGRIGLLMTWTRMTWTLMTGAALGLAGNAGCQNSDGAAPKALSANPRPYIEDVPFPAGFEYIPARSTDNVSGGVRYVKHEYEGKGNPVAARNFFRDRMPESQWNLLSDRNDSGDITLTFEKNGETCTIEIMPRKAFFFFPKTVIRVTISKIDHAAGNRVDPGLGTGHGA